jgi:type IV secretion system protein VirD4
MLSGRGYDGWGPSHQRLALGGRRRWPWLLGGWLLLVGYAEAGDLTGAIFFVLRSLGWLPPLLLAGWLLWLAGRDGRLIRLWRWIAGRRVAAREQHSFPARPAGLVVRERMLRLGGGAYLGVREHGSWVSADPEHAVLVLGPPRSGKTSEVVIPAVLAAPGPVVSTSTKPDVMRTTCRARSEVGQTWLYDPCGPVVDLPYGMRRLHWSPIAAAASWDQALLTARAMAAAGQTGKGTVNEDHWRERSAALLAPLLYAAHLAGQPIASVLSWVLRGNLDEPGKTLEDHDADVACDVLAGIAKTEARERSSIFSATAGTLAAYNSDTTRANANSINFDPDSFPAGCETIYITAPAHMQAQAAPLVVGLLEQIRYATYRYATTPAAHQQPPVFFCLDELANIAPIHDLPALISEAGGQHLHILACLQDLSQARARWGTETAEGMLTLFQTKLILKGIADPKTLEAISLVLGEYDRQLAGHTTGRTLANGFLQPDSYNETISHHTQRHRTLTPGEIAHLPHQRALLLQGVDWQLIHTTPWYRTPTWQAVAGPRDALMPTRFGGPLSPPIQRHALSPRPLSRMRRAKRSNRLAAWPTSGRGISPPGR